MGVKDLWTILSPICERKPLWEFQDSCIAIDLSCWICDSQNVADNSSQCNMYLRNLFFRTAYLLLHGILPIFVLEGDAPELKHDTIERRKTVRQKNSQGTAPLGTILSCDTKRGNRSRLKGIQTQCAELLTSMGVPVLRSSGEAEALCAQLNKMKIANGVISEDSDCFLYGARTVYRNFNLSNNAGASVDVYQMDVIEDKLKLGRNKMIALSLLLGCDYQGKGVHGIGKESALKFLENFNDSDILPRLQEWRTDKYLDLAEKDKKLLSADPSLKLEVKMRQKAMEDPSFPSPDIIAEFLKENDKLKHLSICWKQPSMPKFMSIAIKKLKWEDNYAVEKFLPVLTRWYLLHGDRDKPVVELEKILKKRKPRGIASYEIVWKSFTVTTVEPEVLVTKMYEEVVQQYEDLNCKKSKKKPASKRGKILEDISNQAKSAENKPPKTSKPKVSKKNPTEKGVQTLDKFLVKLNDLSLQDDAENNTVSKVTNKATKKNENRACDAFLAKLSDLSLLDDTENDVTEVTKEEMKINQSLASNKYEEVDFYYDHTDTYYYKIDDEKCRTEQEKSSFVDNFCFEQSNSLQDNLTQRNSQIVMENSVCKTLDSSEKDSRAIAEMTENDLPFSENEGLKVEKKDQSLLMNDVSMRSCGIEQHYHSFMETSVSASSGNKNLANSHFFMDGSPMHTSNFEIDCQRAQNSRIRENCDDTPALKFSTPLSKSSQSELGFRFETPNSGKKTWVSKFHQKCAMNESITASDFECEADDISDLSEIIENIVSRKEI